MFMYLFFTITVSIRTGIDRAISFGLIFSAPFVFVWSTSDKNEQKKFNDMTNQFTSYL